MRKTNCLILLTLAVLSSASAHHGLDNYDTQRLIEFEGTVVEFRLMDPHSILVVETENSDGSNSVWEIEGGSASGIISAGLTQEFLRSMPVVHVKGFQTRDGVCSPRCRLAGEDFRFEQN